MKMRLFRLQWLYRHIRGWDVVYLHASRDHHHQHQHRRRRRLHQSQGPSRARWAKPPRKNGPGNIARQWHVPARRVQPRRRAPLPRRRRRQLQRHPRRQKNAGSTHHRENQRVVDQLVGRVRTRYNEALDTERRGRHVLVESHRRVKLAKTRQEQEQELPIRDELPSHRNPGRGVHNSPRRKRRRRPQLTHREEGRTPSHCATCWTGRPKQFR